MLVQAKSLMGNKTPWSGGSRVFRGERENFRANFLVLGLSTVNLLYWTNWTIRTINNLARINTGLRSKSVQKFGQSRLARPILLDPLGDEPIVHLRDVGEDGIEYDALTRFDDAQAAMAAAEREAYDRTRSLGYGGRLTFTAPSPSAPVELSNV
jgi:hypothetical protein